MRLYDAFQYGVIAAIVPASALYVLRRQAPASFHRGRVAVAIFLLQPQRSAWLRGLGRKFAPAAPTAAACGGCSSGCSTPSARA
jgi:hypothetical protein